MSKSPSQPWCLRTAHLTLVACLLLPAACNTADTPPSEPTTHRDSAGVTIADAQAPLWDDGEGWTVREPPVVEIGATGVGAMDGGADARFADVAGVARLESGEIVVADRASGEVSLYSADGSLVWRTGRLGDGPGEFRDIEFVGVLQGDSVLTYDQALGRVSVFTPDGQFARSFALHPERTAVRPGEAVGMARGGVVVRLRDMREDPGSGVVRWPRQIVAVASTADGLLDERTAVDGCEQLVEVSESRMRQRGYTFGECPVLAASSDRLAVGRGSDCSFRIQSLDRSASPLLIRRQCEAERVTAAHVETYTDAVTAMAFSQDADPESDEVRSFRASLREGPTAPILPVVRSAHLDDDGKLWVEPYWVVGSDPPPYEVFAPDGTWLGAVALPAGLDRGFYSDMAPHIHIGSDFVLGVWRSELDTHIVRMYRIEK